MENLLIEWYMWLKATHIIFVIFWMAGLLYLPRLFVYHSDFTPADKAYRTFLTMERKLLYFIMTPSMVITVLLGLALFIMPGVIAQGSYWFHGKLTLIIALILFHIMLALLHKGFNAGRNKHSQRFFRLINEIPAVIAIAIVILAVIKPF